MGFDEKLFFETDAGMCALQVRLEGGDASSDSVCFSCTRSILGRS
jgi:hypothetical protein